MYLLSVNNIAASFADRVLFSDVSFEVQGGEKIGFVGVNGSGKTTLFRVLKRELTPDAGDVIIPGGTRLGYMEQFACKDSDKTLYNEALTVFSDLEEMEFQLEELHDKIDFGDSSDETIARQTELRERFERGGGLTYKSRTSSALTGLGFTDGDFALPVSVLSGGQRSKLQFAKLLLSDADLLLLDEPTNHLDISSVEWLEEFLANYKGAYIVISHDRYFLDKVTGRTLELENGRFRSYKGNYSAYIAQREIEKMTEQRSFNETTREIHRLEEVVEQQRRWKHKKNKKTHTVDNTLKAIERLEETLAEPAKAPESMRFSFKSAQDSGNDVLSARNIALAFGEKELFHNVNVEIKKGERVFLIGDNGCGKTSLFKVLTGQYRADAGEFKLGANVSVGYFDQAQRGLSEEKTALDEVWDAYPKMTETAVRTALAAFLFKGDDIYKQISELSGGERARVALLKLMLSGANFLLLDEPTNHLDIMSCEALENALLGYDGTLFVISHDRYLINKLAHRLYRLTGNGAESYLGNYDYYLEKQQTTAEKPVSEKPKMSEQALDYKQRKERESERRKLNTKANRAETRVDELDREITEKTGELAELTDYQKAMELSEQIEALRQEQERAMEEWETASKALEDFDD